MMVGYLLDVEAGCDSASSEDGEVVCVTKEERKESVKREVKDVVRHQKG